MSDDAESNGVVNDPLRTRREFCEQGKFGLKTLQRIESRGEAPPCIEITPGLVRYRQSAIDAWFAAKTATGARPAGRAPTKALEAAQRKRRGTV
jgi:predicted DNA-binding transcriptional regulator AlpA